MSSAHPTFDRAKLRPPRTSHAIVGHERLLALRPDPSESAVVTLVAPAGYGKSTVLAEWANHDDGRVLWVTLDVHDSDPAVLVGNLATALLDASAPAPELADAMRSPAASVWSMLMPRLSAALHEAAPLTLVLDDAHALASSESWDVIDWLMLHVPEASQVLVGGRSLAGSGTARLEVNRQLTMRGVHDLALTDDEAYELLRGLGSATTRESAATLNRACDGWVSGLLMSSAGSDSGASDADGEAPEQLVEAYIQAEVLRPLEPDDRDFMVWSSVLRMTSAPLCDAVLERSDSHDVLERMCGANAFVSRVGDGWCQLHELIRSALVRLAERRDPEMVAELRGRAAAWHAEQGNGAEAVQYSRESGRSERTIELMGRFVVPLYSQGRMAMLAHWFDWVESRGLTTDDPAFVCGAAVAWALAGDPRRSERWARGFRPGGRGSGRAAGLDEGYRSLVAAWQGDRGAEAMLADAARAVELLPPDSPWLKSAQGSLAVAQLMNGLVAESAVGFQQIVDEHGPGWSDTNARAASMTFLGVLALREQRVDDAAELLDRAIALREESGITEQGLQAFSDAVATRLAVLQGADTEAARRRLTHAQRIRSLTTWAVPSLALAIRLELVKAHLALADVAGSRAVAREMADILHHRPDLGSFEREARELSLCAAEQAEAAQGPSSLTAAELRLVPWLATHLSFREIGERLYLSTNTVKTEALSTYRKLGASSRSEAVDAAVRVGLLDPASLPGVLKRGRLE